MLIKVKRGDTAALKMERDGDLIRFAICAVDQKGLVVEELAHVSIGNGEANAIIAYLKAPHYEE